ncbi:MAG: hypothetical protein ACOC1F_06715 [Myxococcota bacterium]
MAAASGLGAGAGDEACGEGAGGGAVPPHAMGKSKDEQQTAK